MPLAPKFWYYPDAMTTVPSFQLYGEGEGFADPGFVHIEAISSRSLLNGWEIGSHSHDTLDQLLVVRSGAVAVRIEGSSRHLRGPATIHVPAASVHGFRFGDDVDGDVVTFSTELRASLTATQPAPVALASGPLVLEIGDAAVGAMSPLLDQLHVECLGHAEGRIAAAAWLVGLLLLQTGRLAGEGADPLAGDTRVTAFRALVDQHFREHRSVMFYAGKLGMTERSLTRLTQARLGCAPMHYLHRRLLLEARRQLIYGSQSIARIADELGFADPSYFTRFHRRMTGDTPSSVRRSS